MNILVTGGAGFIGSNVTELLCDIGHEVTVIDDLSFGYKKFVDKRAQFVEGSLQDENLLKKILKGKHAVIHLAASSIIKFSFDNPLGYIENNINNGVKLLEAMRANNVNKIIFSSSASVYGEPKHIPIKEEDSKEPLTIYGSSKLAFEQILCSYYYSFGINSVSLRYFNAYGPRDEQKPATRAVPIWIKAVLEQQAIPLFWNGRQKRDYVYVKDIAQAHVDVLGLEGLHYFNIGSGSGVIMLDIIKTLERVSNTKIKIKNLGKRSGDPKQLIADISKIKKTVNWEPKVSLEKGLEKTFRYYEKFYKTNLSK